MIVALADRFSLNHSWVWRSLWLALNHTYTRLHLHTALAWEYQRSKIDLSIFPATWNCEDRGHDIDTEQLLSRKRALQLARSWNFLLSINMQHGQKMDDLANKIAIQLSDFPWINWCAGGARQSLSRLGGMRCWSTASRIVFGCVQIFTPTFMPTQHRCSETSTPVSVPCIRLPCKLVQELSSLVP